MFSSGYSHNRCCRLNYLPHVLVVVALFSLCINRSKGKTFFCKTDICNVIDCVVFHTEQPPQSRLINALVCSNYRTIRIVGFQIKNSNSLVNLFIKNLYEYFYMYLHCIHSDLDCIHFV
jgi:hypothetical protein